MFIGIIRIPEIRPLWGRTNEYFRFLIKVVNYLLIHQIKTLETAFIKEGGLREKMTKARINYRNKGQ